MHRVLSVVAMLASATNASEAPIPVRTPIGSLALSPVKSVTHVEMTRVDFAPGQEMPKHMHPVPVICVVSKGAFLASIGDQPPRQVGIGDTTIEPAGAIVHFFRNLSKTEPGQLYCSTLAGPDDKQLSVMLDK
jgi:quercetin dioxygenase-like cupin family protein